MMGRRRKDFERKGGGYVLAFWKAYDIRKQIAQVLQRNFCKLFANNPSKEICTFLVILNYTSGYLKFSKLFACLKWHGQGLFNNV